MRRECKLVTERLRCIVVSIDDEITCDMQRTCGVVSWEDLAKIIAGGPEEIQPASRGALRRRASW